MDLIDLIKMINFVRILFLFSCGTAMVKRFALEQAKGTFDTATNATAIIGYKANKVPGLRYLGLGT